MRTRHPLTITLLALLALGTVEALSAQTRPLVVVDPGHGGAEIGVEHEGWLEKDLVLRIAFSIGAELVDAGFDVVFTRTRDEAVEWDNRRRIAEEAGAVALLMLHANGSDDPTEHGAEVYVHADGVASANLANEVGRALRDAGSAVVVEDRPWPFLQSPTVATAMIELAFMTHPVERRLLERRDFHVELGQALASAVRAHLDR